MTDPECQKHINAVRRRIRLLLAEKYGLYGIAFGAFISGVVVLLSSRYDALIDSRLWYGFIVVGLLSGIICALIKRFSDSAVAASIDKRAELKERVSTAVSISSVGEIEAAVVDDARNYLNGLDPKALFPRKFGKPYWAFAVAAIFFLTAFFFPDIPAFQSKQRKTEIRVMKREGQKIVKVAKSIKKANIKKRELRELAARLTALGKKMESGRMTKKQAIIKSRKLSEDLKKEQDKLALQNKPAQKSMAQMNYEMKKNESDLAKSVAKDIAKQKNIPFEKALSQLPSDKELAKLAKQQSLSKSEQAQLEKALEKYSDPNNSLPIPKELSEALAKLLQNKDYQKAMEIMRKLALKLNNNKNLSAADRKMLEEQMKQLAEALKNTDLDELAKMMRENAEKLAKMSPEELKELLKQMEECKKAGLCLGMGLSACNGACASIGMGSGGKGGIGSGFGNDNANTGPKGKLNAVKNTVKSSSQLGSSGMIFSAGETKSSPDSTPSAHVPYTDVLPNYKKAAENSVSQDKIPPAYRKRVKDYFSNLE